MTKFDIIYDSFNQMDRMCNRLSDDNVRLHINYNADVTFSGVNTYQLRYILKNLLEKTEITTVYIDNIIDMPSGKSITLKPYEDFKNSDCVEFYKTNNPNMYQIKPFRRNGYITELTITRL